MACRVELLAVHVHGHEADLDAFFEGLEEAVEKFVDEADKLYPSLEFLDPTDSAVRPDDEDEDDGA